MPTTVSAPETLSETRTQTRELLLQTALSMLEQGWFPSITELANASGVSRATAYRYFPSQAALVSTVVDESLGPVLQWQPTSTSVEARVNELLDFAYPRMEQHEGALRAALQVALHQWANERARRARPVPSPARQAARGWPNALQRRCGARARSWTAAARRRKRPPNRRRRAAAGFVFLLAHAGWPGQSNIV
ncbi:helix-turn-helix domain of resolvase family protein [Burkholderia pseudomallei MSHR3458]|nr:helix-turn-helix domain of resolvase family protein [Burkholderia pseudomallei MSHR3458]